MKMPQIPDSELNKIGDMGWYIQAYYYDRKTNTIVSEWDHEDPQIEWDGLDEKTAEEIKNRSRKYLGNPDRYLRLTEQDSRDSYRTMASFVAQLPESKYRYKMEAALEGQKPFRNFKDQVDNSPHRQEWFDYKRQRELDGYHSYLNAVLEEE